MFLAINRNYPASNLETRNPAFNGAVDAGAGEYLMQLSRIKESLARGVGLLAIVSSNQNGRPTNDLMVPAHDGLRLARATTYNGGVDSNITRLEMPGFAMAKEPRYRTWEINDLLSIPLQNIQIRSGKKSNQLITPLSTITIDSDSTSVANRLMEHDSGEKVIFRFGDAQEYGEELLKRHQA